MLVTRICAIKYPKIRLDGLEIFEHPSADPNDFLKAAYRSLSIQYPKFFKMDNLGKLAFIAAELLLRNQDITNRFEERGIGIVIQNASSSLETDEKHQESINDRQNYFPSPSVFVYTLPNIMVGEISIRHKLKGENAVLISEKPDAGQLFEYVDELFTKNRVKCCITGWVEAYHERLTACLALVENEEAAKSFNGQREMIIFDPSNLERIFNEA